MLQDKRQEHLKFCKYAIALIEMVSGKTQNSNIDASLEKIRKVSDASAVTSGHFLNLVGDKRNCRICAWFCIDKSGWPRHRKNREFGC